MPSPDYEKAKADCWDTFKILGGCEEVITKKDAFNYAFSKAYALGKQEKDAEEMLSVSRKRVQEMFTEAQKSAPSCEYDRGFRGAELTILRNLFGSKCLPDNVDTSAPNVDSLSQKSSENCDNEKHISNNPAKPKFKVGDNVRHKGPHHELGEIAKYWGDKKPGIYSVRIGGEYHNISESMLELYSRDYKVEEIANHVIKPVEEHFDNALRDSFSKDRRLNIAAMVMQGILSNSMIMSKILTLGNIKPLVQCALSHADALIAEAELSTQLDHTTQ